MILDFSTSMPVPGTASSATVRDALQAMAGHLGLRGAVAPVIASAATTSIFAGAGAGDAVGLVEISGATGISSFGSADLGERRWVLFQGALTINHSTSLVCPGAVNLVTSAGTLILVEGTSAGTRIVGVISPPAGATVQAFPRGHIFGLTLSNNVADAANDIDIAAGEARDDANTTNLVLASALTKRLDANWVAGTNQGGLDAGTKANSTTYHLHLISNGTTVDALFSTSHNAPTMPSGYTLRRRIGAVITDGSGGIRAFVQDGDRFLLVTPPLDVNASITATRSARALTVPAGIVVQAKVRAINSSGSLAVVVQPLAEADASPSGSASPLYNLYDFTFEGEVRTNTAREIALKAQGSSATVTLVTLGWTDTRGRLA